MNPRQAEFAKAQREADEHDYYVRAYIVARLCGATHAHAEWLAKEATRARS